MSNLTSAKSSLIKILQTKKKEKLITLDSEKREFGLPSLYPFCVEIPSFALHTKVSFFKIKGIKYSFSYVPFGEYF